MYVWQILRLTPSLTDSSTSNQVYTFP